MRTKTLLLTAALSAAGVATSMAQVYSVNAVGYINISVPAGFSLIANQLNVPDSTIPSLLSSNAPVGTQIYQLNADGSYSTSIFDPQSVPPVWVNTQNGGAVTNKLNPGEGAWINAPVGFTLTFVGEVPQGSLSNSIPAGFSIKSSIVPQAGLIDTNALNYVAAPGDGLYRFLPGPKTYETYLYDPQQSPPRWVLNGVPTIPSVNVGEAFFIFRAGPATVWTRTFSVN